MIAETGGNRVLFVDDMIVAQTVQFSGADAGDNVFCNHLKNFGGQATGHAHFFDLFRGFY